MKNYRSVFWLNTLSLLLVAGLILYSKWFGPSVSSLFLPPPFSSSPNVALLTHTFQVLCTIPPIVCAFSWGLLKAIQPQSQQKLFILFSALITGGFLVNEIFRVHVLLGLLAGVPKLGVILVYAIVAIAYGLGFWRRIQSTPYILLLSGMGLLFLGITVDSLHLGSNGVSSLLEGVPKLFSEINIALYFWYVCYCEIVQSLNRPNLKVGGR